MLAGLPIVYHFRVNSYITSLKFKYELIIEFKILSSILLFIRNTNYKKQIN